MPGLSTLLRLGRISNVPTVWTNVLAGSVIAGGAQAPNEIVLIVLEVQRRGMYLNSFDRTIDARDRPAVRSMPAKFRPARSSIGFGLMGLCRALVYIGTGVAVTDGVSNTTIIPAVALACHVAGLTYAAKQESLEGWKTSGRWRCWPCRCSQRCRFCSADG